MFATPPEVLQLKPRFCNMVTHLESLVYAHTLSTCTVLRGSPDVHQLLYSAFSAGDDRGARKRDLDPPRNGCLTTRPRQNGLQALKITFLARFNSVRFL